MRRFGLLLIGALLAGCASEPGGGDAGTARDAAARADAQARADAGAEPQLDAGAGDAGAGDAGVEGPLGWRAAAPLAGGPRQETAVVAWGGEVVVIGGYDETRRFGRAVEAYDPGADRWRALPDLPVAMHHANAVVFGGDLWVIGFLGSGFDEDGRIFVLEAGAASWQPRGVMPADRARGASVVGAWGGAIYIAGGLHGRLPVRWVDRFDPATEQWRPLPPMPREVDHAVGGVIGDALYVAGGRAGLISAHVADLDVLDLTAATWSAGPPMPTSRGGAAGAVRNGALFVIGGEGNPQNPPSNLFDAVESFDPAEGQWRTHPAITPPRHGMGAATVDGRIYVPGGADVEAFGAVDTHEVLAP